MHHTTNSAASSATIEWNEHWQYTLNLPLSSTSYSAQNKVQVMQTSGSLLYTTVLSY